MVKIIPKIISSFFLLFILSSQGKPNIPFPTLGGLQFWDDVSYCDGQKIQRHAWTGHHRTLNKNNLRIAWGSLSHCQSFLQENQQNQKPLFVLIHGLGRTSHSMRILENNLQENFVAQIEIHRISYASLLNPIEEISQNLKSIVAENSHRPIYCITHSYGALVLRQASDDNDLAIEGAITLAAPHQGSVIAENFKKLKIDILLGAARKNLRNPNAPQFPIPDFPIYTVAGIETGFWRRWPLGRLLPKYNDGIVCERNTRLKGEQHFVIAANHTFIMNSPFIVELSENMLHKTTLP